MNDDVGALMGALTGVDPFGRYYTVQIPWSPTPSGWHPTEKSGPFSVLERGAFKTREEARAWAKRELQGQKYRVIRVPAFNWQEEEE